MNRICTINRCMKLQLHSAHYCPPYGTGTDFSFDLSDLSLWGASSFLLVFSVSISWLRLRPQILMSSLLKFLFHSGLQARIAFLTVVWTPTDNVCCSPTSKKPWKRQDTRVIKTGDFRDFPGDPVVETPPSNAGYMGSIPGQEIKILHTVGQQSPSAAVKTQHSQIQSINQSINLKKPLNNWGLQPSCGGQILALPLPTL